MQSLLTFREQYPEKSRLPTPEDFAIKKDINGVDLIDPYSSVSQDLAAISAIDCEISANRKAKMSVPSRLPSNTGYTYSDWDKKQEKNRTMRKAQACLEMRVSQREAQAKVSKRVLAVTDPFKNLPRGK